MSLELLDMAVSEVKERESLPPCHFLCNKVNIESIKAMIKGSDKGANVPNGKAWLFTIVNNSHSGAPLCV